MDVISISVGNALERVFVGKGVQLLQWNFFPMFYTWMQEMVIGY